MQKLAKRLPPLTFSACVAELRVLGVKFYVAEGEADSPTAELSQRLNGYMASNGASYIQVHAATLSEANVQRQIRTTLSSTLAVEVISHFILWNTASGTLSI